MSYTVEGRVDTIQQEQTFGSGFKKRTLWIETIEQYPQFIAIDFTRDNTSLLDSFRQGDEVSVSFNVGGRKYTKEGEPAKVFNSITGYRIAKKQ